MRESRTHMYEKRLLIRNGGLAVCVSLAETIIALYNDMIFFSVTKDCSWEGHARKKIERVSAQERTIANIRTSAGGRCIIIYKCLLSYIELTFKTKKNGNVRRET